MKTFKLFSMAALALMMAACSSEDNEIATAPKTQGVKFTATISTGNSGATRALSENGNKIVATWEVDETVALVYTVGGTAYNTMARVTAVDGNGKATIEATLDATPTEETAVTLIYPAWAADGTTGNVRSAAEQLEGQDGTLETISKFEARKGTGTLTVNGTTATLKEAVTMENQYAIFKFTTQSKSGEYGLLQNTNVTKLTVTTGGQDYVITPASATSTLYAALPAVSGQTVSFTATDGSNLYAASKDNVSFAAAKYYQSTVKMGKVIEVFQHSEPYIDFFGGPAPLYHYLHIGLDQAYAIAKQLSAQNGGATVAVVYNHDDMKVTYALSSDASAEDHTDYNFLLFDQYNYRVFFATLWEDTFEG